MLHVPRTLQLICPKVLTQVMYIIKAQSLQSSFLCRYTVVAVALIKSAHLGSHLCVKTHLLDWSRVITMEGDETDGERRGEGGREKIEEEREGEINSTNAETALRQNLMSLSSSIWKQELTFSTLSLGCPSTNLSSQRKSVTNINTRRAQATD